MPRVLYGFLNKIAGKQPNTAEIPADISAKTANLFLDMDEKDKAIIKCLQEGKKYKQIAFELKISETTLKRQLKSIYKTAEVSNRVMFLQKYGEDFFAHEQFPVAEHPFPQPDRRARRPPLLSGKRT
jgi:DNA-binding NarL/FixJ family response regulator